MNKYSVKAPVKTYKKLTDNIFIEEPIKDVPLILYLNRIKQKRDELEKILTTQEPSSKELIEYAKQHHPYYDSDKGMLQPELDKLNQLISTLENIK